MKAWNHRHPNIVLVFFVVLAALYAVYAVVDLHQRRWGWVIIDLLAFVWADSRCRYWYDQTGKDES